MRKAERHREQMTEDDWRVLAQLTDGLAKLSAATKE